MRDKKDKKKRQVQVNKTLVKKEKEKLKDKNIKTLDRINQAPEKKTQESGKTKSENENTE